MKIKFTSQNQPTQVLWMSQSMPNGMSVNNHILMVGQTGSGKSTLFKYLSINNENEQEARKTISELSIETVKNQQELMAKYLQPEKFQMLYEVFKDHIKLSEMSSDLLFLGSGLNAQNETKNIAFLLEEQRYEMTMEEVNSFLFKACRDNHFDIIKTIFDVYFSNKFHRSMPDLFSSAQNVESRNMSNENVQKNYWEVINYFLYELNIDIASNEMPFLEKDIQQHIQKRNAYNRLMKKNEKRDNEVVSKRKI